MMLICDDIIKIMVNYTGNLESYKICTVDNLARLYGITVFNTSTGFLRGAGDRYSTECLHFSN